MHVAIFIQTTPFRRPLGHPLFPIRCTQWLQRETFDLPQLSKKSSVSNALFMGDHLQEAGNYKVAHTQLLQTFLELQRHGRRPPSELSRQLMLLHSYVLVKTLVKLGDHE